MTTETPPKSPRKIEPPPSLTSVSIMEMEKQSQTNKERKMFDEVFVNRKPCAGRSKAKTNSENKIYLLNFDVITL